jgi:hypothetical protein
MKWEAAKRISILLERAKARSCMPLRPLAGKLRFTHPATPTLLYDRKVLGSYRSARVTAGKPVNGVVAFELVSAAAGQAA